MALDRRGRRLGIAPRSAEGGRTDVLHFCSCLTSRPPAQGPSVENGSASCAPRQAQGPRARCDVGRRQPAPFVHSRAPPSRTLQAEAHSKYAPAARSDLEVCALSNLLRRSLPQPTQRHTRSIPPGARLSTARRLRTRTSGPSSAALLERRGSRPPLTRSRGRLRTNKGAECYGLAPIGNCAAALHTLWGHVQAAAAGGGNATVRLHHRGGEAYIQAPPIR